MSELGHDCAEAEAELTRLRNHGLEENHAIYALCGNPREGYTLGDEIRAQLEEAWAERDSLREELAAAKQAVNVAMLNHAEAVNDLESVRETLRASDSALRRANEETLKGSRRANQAEAQVAALRDLTGELVEALEWAASDLESWARRLSIKKGLTSLQHARALLARAKEEGR